VNILVTRINFKLIITWYLAYSCGQQGNRRDKKCRQIDDDFDDYARMRRCDVRTSPDEAKSVLHLKQMDAPIGQVLTSHRRRGCHGRRFWSKTQNTNKTPFLAS
jgi:hypothetical protein